MRQYGVHVYKGIQFVWLHEGANERVRVEALDPAHIKILILFSSPPSEYLRQYLYLNRFITSSTTDN